MSKPVLSVVVGVESSDDEIELVKSAFDDAFDVEVDRGLYRFSLNLPMHVELAINAAVGLLGAAVYDLIKAGVIQLFRRWRRTRSLQVVIVREREVYVLHDDQWLLRQGTQEIEFSSSDELFMHLKKTRDLV